MKIYELAKEHGLGSLELVEILNKINIPVKNHMTELSSELINDVNNHSKLSKEYLNLISETKEKSKFSDINEVIILNTKKELPILKAEIAKLKTIKKSISNNSNVYKISVYTKDGFSAQKTNKEGMVIGSYDVGYVPFEGSNNFELCVDIETGKIKDWDKMKQSLEKVLRSSDS